MPDTAPDLVYFGDSLTDNGNLYEITDGVLPNLFRNLLGGPTNAVSDGVTHAAYTAELLGLDSANYAIAAAQANGSLLLGDLLTDFGLGGLVLVPDTDPSLQVDINLSAQVDRFQADTLGQDLGNTTAMILIGGNDFATIDPEAPTAVIDAIAVLTSTLASTQAAVLDLAFSGVGNIVVSTQPNPDFYPSSGEYSAFELLALDFALESYNSLLTASAETLAFFGVNVEILDTNAITRAITEDPTGFGLIAPYEQTQQESDVLDDFDNDQVAFYDSIHPSTATHGVMGSFNAHFLNGDAIEALGDGADLAQLGGTNDLILGYGGADSVNSGAGQDDIFGGSGNDLVFAGGDDDLISGGAGDDDLRGGSGNDVLDGDGGNDTLQGGYGNDVLIDGLGDDLALGGYGNDVFIFTEGSLIGGTNGTDNDVFDGGLGTDTLYLVLSGETFLELSGDLSSDAILGLGISTSNIENVELLNGRSELASLQGEDWYEEADLWGLI